MLLTDISIKALRPPESGAKTFFDDNIPGFGVRVSQGGTKTYILVHGKARTRLTIGRVGILKLKAARDKARDILAEKQLGRYQSSTVTFSEALDLYIRNHLEKNVRPKTANETKRLLNKHFLPKLRHDKLTEITRASVAPIVANLLDTPSLALHAHTAITGFFRWARGQFLDNNPLDGLKPPYKPSSRSRVLSDDELRSVWRTASQAGPYGKLITLLILTGQRVNQIARLRAEFIEDAAMTVTWPAELMKGNRRHSIPYGPLAATILATLPREGLLFPARGKPDKPLNGFSKLKADFDQVGGVTGWTLHDLRRTFSTKLAELGVSQHIVERLLDHRTGLISGVAAIYNRFQYMDEMRDAIARWERRLIELTAR